MSLSDLFIISLWVCVGMSSFTHCQMDREVSPLQITACHLCLQSLHLSESLYSSSLSPGSHAVTLNRLPCWFTQSMSSSIKVSQSRTMCVLNHTEVDTDVAAHFLLQFASTSRNKSLFRPNTKKQPIEIMHTLLFLALSLSLPLYISLPLTSPSTRQTIRCIVREETEQRDHKTRI